MEPFTPVTTVEELETFGVPAPMIRDKVLDTLQDVHREWLEASTLVFVATSSLDGRCDVSPKGDPPGFVRVLGPTRLAIPERPGNRRLDGFHNILQNPHVGLVCLIPGRGDTLRVNGRAQLVSDLPDLDSITVQGHRPSLALLIDVEEVFFHCPKAFRRSRTWQPETWQPTAARPYPDIALALWRKGQSEDDVPRHHATTVDNEDLYPHVGPDHHRPAP
jgi:PPOX class probable FMN-dependent enzyme